MRPRENNTSTWSVPRIFTGALLLLGIAALAYVFRRYGMAAGAAMSIIPMAICMLWASLRNPAWAMLGMLVVNYYVMGIGRYVYNFPSGVVLDVAIGFNIALLILHALTKKVEWQRARTGITLVAIIWAVYCVLQFFNPEAVSSSGWFSSVRTLSFHFLIIVILTQLLMSEYKYIKYMLIIWALLTITAVAQACIQKFIGFNSAEKYWLYVLGGHTTHIIYTGIRYFSFFSDAANFSASMGFSMVVFSIAGLYYRSPMFKIFLFVVAAAACYGMLISGTRSALAVPFAGYMAFIFLSRNFRMVLLGGLAVFGAFIFLNFTTIGQGNPTIRRARSAFNTEDASFQVRLENQAKIRELMDDKPFGAGLGHGGGKAKVFAPDAPLSQIPTDSWYVMVWVETGIVGLILHISILLFVLAWGSFQVLFRLKNKELRGVISALISGIFGITVMSYGNEVLGQIPTGVLLYMSMGFISLAPRFDRELNQAETSATPKLNTPSHPSSKH